jgi:hypothetical protein
MLMKKLTKRNILKRLVKRIKSKKINNKKNKKIPKIYQKKEMSHH